MKPTISIIIPVYNRASLVIRTLDSIAAQTLQPDRIIVVDNNSSDGSHDAVKRWMDAYSGTARCTLLTERKPGAAAARNNGLREADSEIVAFFDSDDTMRPDFVRHIINSFDSETDTDILCWKALEHLRDGSTRFKKFNRHADFEFHIFHSFLYTLGFAGRRSLITAAGGWDESLSTWDDWELGIRILLAQPNIKISTITMVDIYLQEESITGTSYHSRGKQSELAIDHAEADVADSSHPDKERLLRLLLLRRAILAGLYRKEGFTADARRLITGVMAKATDVKTRIICRLSYMHTAIGLRGAAHYARLV